MNKLILTILIILLILGGGYLIWKNQNKINLPINQNNTATPSFEYINNDYGFKFDLPENWRGYSIVKSTWEGLAVEASGETPVERGPIVLIRNPKWTVQNPYQDIPIMIFTLDQWNKLEQDKFHIGAAPIGPNELGRNSKYVFALPARYNYAFPSGWEEVENIFGKKPLHAFNI